MTEPYGHVRARLACMAFTDPPTSHNYWPEEEEWQHWIVSVYRRAVEKANGPIGLGPKAVASWASMRAASRGWMDLFRFWAERAHKAGRVGPEFIASPNYVSVDRVLVMDERTHIGTLRTKEEYEEAFGYPISSSHLCQDLW